MHPQRICDDFMQMGARLTLDDEKLFIERPENVHPELIEFAKLNKRRIVRYLQGSYTKKEHSLKSTIDKIVAFMIHVDQDIDAKLTDWLRKDDESMYLIMKLLQMLYDNGWRYEVPAANFETIETDKLSQEIFDRAMSYFKGA